MVYSSVRFTNEKNTLQKQLQQQASETTRQMPGQDISASPSAAPASAAASTAPGDSVPLRPVTTPASESSRRVEAAATSTEATEGQRLQLPPPHQPQAVAQQQHQARAETHRHRSPHRGKSSKSRSRSRDHDKDASESGSSSSSESDSTRDDTDSQSSEDSHARSRAPARKVLDALRSAERAGGADVLSRRLRRSFFPKKVSEAETIALHGRLFSPAAWASMQAYPPTVSASDFDSRLSGEARSLAVIAARFLQYGAFRDAALQCGLLELVQLLVEHHADTLSDTAVAQKLRDVCNWSVACFDGHKTWLRKLVAHIKAGKLQELQCPAPTLPAHTPAVGVYDEECDKLVRRLLRVRRSADGPGSYPHPKRGKPRQGGFRSASRGVFGRGTAARRDQQESA